MVTIGLTAAIICPLGACGGTNLSQSEDSETRSLSDIQNDIDESMQKWEDSQDDFYEALEQDRRAYVIQRAGELGISLDDPVVEKLLQPVDSREYQAIVPVRDEAIATLATTTAPEQAPAKPDATTWWRDGLSDEGKVLYDQWYGYLRDGYQQMHLDLGYEGHDDTFRETWAAIQCDHPELFWISTTGSNYHIRYYDDPVLGSDVTHNFACAVEDIPRLAGEIDAAVNQFKSFVGNDTDASHVATRAAIWLSNRLVYDHAYGPQNQCVISSFLSDRTVCAGYGMAYKMLLGAYDIPCVAIIGYADTGQPVENEDYASHLWNAVWMNGKWGCVDVTWLDNDENGYSWSYFGFESNANEHRDVTGPRNVPATETLSELNSYGKRYADSLDKDYQTWLSEIS